MFIERLRRFIALPFLSLSFSCAAGYNVKQLFRRVASALPGMENAPEQNKNDCMCPSWMLVCVYLFPFIHVFVPLFVRGSFEARVSVVLYFLG